MNQTTQAYYLDMLDLPSWQSRQQSQPRIKPWFASDKIKDAEIHFIYIGSAQQSTSELAAYFQSIAFSLNIEPKRVSYACYAGTSNFNAEQLALALSELPPLKYKVIFCLPAIATSLRQNKIGLEGQYVLELAENEGIFSLSTKKRLMQSLN